MERKQLEHHKATLQTIVDNYTDTAAEPSVERTLIQAIANVVKDLIDDTLAADEHAAAVRRMINEGGPTIGINRDQARDARVLGPEEREAIARNADPRD